MASFRPGDTCFVFVDLRGWVVGGFQGKLEVANGRLASGEPVSGVSARLNAVLRGRRAQEETSFIYGQIHDVNTQRPLKDVLITCVRDGFPDQVWTAKTDVKGEWRIDGLPLWDPRVPPPSAGEPVHQ